jgi:2-hydroxycyclohexanecarboxyl-CoA dehydrogenase
VASDSARAGAAEEAPYAASKAGLLGLSKSLAREHARDGLTVNVVCPGPIDGPMVAAAMAGKDAMLAKLTAAIPLRRLAVADDVAAAIAWLCSPDASYVTGQTLSVSGGLTMH